MAAKKSKKSAKPSARKPAQRGAPKPAKPGAPRSAKPGASKLAKSPPRAAAKPARVASKGESSGVVYSDVRRDALAWQLEKLR